MVYYGRVEETRIQASVFKSRCQALLDDAGLLEGLNIHRGKVTYEAVANALGYEYVPARRVLGM